MKGKFKCGIPALASGIWLCWAMPVQAGDYGNAVQDILLQDRFKGAMSSISWLTNFIDVWFIRVITITAFFIIMSSVFKNVAAGAVCAFPKFWRRVHEAHERKAISGLFSKIPGVGKALGQGGSVGSGAGAAGGGGIGDVIFAIIPDFMALTEFADTDISPKQYFMKAIPEMIAAVCIGIFIYDGLYRDTLATVGTAGSRMVSNILSAADPDKVTKFIFNNIKEPNNSFKNDPTIQGEWIYAISSEMYKKLNALSTVYNTTEEGKQGLMGYCEQYAQSLVSSNPTVFVANDTYYYKMTNVTVQSLTVLPNDVQPQPDNLYFSHTENLATILQGNSSASADSGWKNPQDGNLLNIQVACNFEVTARDGKTVETAISAIEGTLGAAGDFKTNVATVSLSSIGITPTSNTGSSGLCIDLTQAGVIESIGNAVFGQVAVSDGTCQYNRNTGAEVTFDGYGVGTGHQVIPWNGTSATVVVNISYSATTINSDGTLGTPTDKKSKITVTFTP